MEIFLATDLLEILEKGGSTYPWMMKLENPRTGEQGHYIVKMFTHKQITEQNAVAKEVYGNVLARAFGLPVPRAVLARFTPDFLTTLSDEARNKNAEYHRGLRFATEHVENVTLFGDQIPNSLINGLDLASLYAFDNLVWNLDRGGFRNKPNLLIGERDYVLIDHEQIFPFHNDPDQPNDALITNFLKREWKYQYQQHLFYPYLKKSKKALSNEPFSFFMKGLKEFDPEILSEKARFLQENGHPCGDVDGIIDYLCTVKNNPDIFLHILKQQLS